MFNQILVVKKLNATDDPIVNEVMRSLEQYGRLNRIPVYDYNAMTDVATQPSLFIAIGGDGTMLYAAKESALFPGSSYVIGFNAGKLGFLVDDVGSDSQLSEFLDDIRQEHDGFYKIDHRSMIQADLGNLSKHEYALNEFVITTPQAMNSMFRYQVKVNGQHVATHSSSGLIVGTATGSTAFTMSVGGAVIQPNSNSMQIVPIAPHSLTSRPLILSGTDVVEVIVEKNSDNDVIQLINDGQLVKNFKFSHKIRIESAITTLGKENGRVRIIRKNDWNFFEVLATKMAWNK